MLLQDNEVHDGVLEVVGSIFSAFHSGFGFHHRHDACLPMHVRSTDHVDVLGYGGDPSAGYIDAADGIVPTVGNTGYR